MGGAQGFEVMSESPFKILEAPRLKKFVMISLCLHVTVMVAQGMMPDEKITQKKFPPVKVSYLPPEKKPEPQKSPTFIDTPKPRKIETPKSSEMIARYDSRVHSNQKPKKRLVYQNKKTVVPKTPKSTAASKKLKLVAKKKIVPAPTPQTIRKPFRLADRGLILPKTKGEVAEDPPPKKITGGTLALLEGFDAEKYAGLDTQSDTAEDDDKVISLDTRESKYASYFARLKHQIERVWGYPEEAARRGISGRLTLRFQISKDGNLMNVRLIDNSGYNLLDEAALQAVKTAAPYYPFPVTIDRETLSILATFIYTPTYSTQYSKRR